MLSLNDMVLGCVLVRRRGGRSLGGLGHERSKRGGTENC